MLLSRDAERAFGKVGRASPRRTVPARSCPGAHGVTRPALELLKRFHGRTFLLADASLQIGPQPNLPRGWRWRVGRAVFDDQAGGCMHAVGVQVQKILAEEPAVEDAGVGGGAKVPTPAVIVSHGQAHDGKPSRATIIEL